MKMTPNTLARKIQRLPERPPMTAAFELALEKRGMRSNRVWYKSQKEHWCGWLRHYDGPGAYGRRNWDRSAEFVYNHIVCPPMELWLGEASGIQRARVAKAKQAALSASPNLAAQAAAIRKVIPWSLVEFHLAKRES